MTHTGYIGTAPDGNPTLSFHPEPPGWCCANHVLALPLETDKVGAAVHEAGHLVADLLVGIHVINVEISTAWADLTCGPVAGVSGTTQIGRIEASPHAYLTMLAAGEQAHQRWLRESGLWTPERTWALERGALDDREKAVKVLQEHHTALNVTGACQLFWQYRPEAAALLDSHWGRVLEVAKALTDRSQLSGDEASQLAGLPNPCEPEADLALE